MTHIEAQHADITALEVDAIVNAANEHLQHGGGVAAAISRAGGPSIQRESNEWVDAHGPLTPGTAAVTGAGDMPARVVVHVAGPRYREDQDNEALLRTAVAAALVASMATSARTVAVPAISAGVFGYPVEEATAVIADEARRWCAANPDALDRVLLVGYDDRVTQEFQTALAD